jgi:rusticyanin
MTRTRITALVSAAVIAAAGLGAGAAIAIRGASTPAPAGATISPDGPGYSYYRSMMGRYVGATMMGGSAGSYQWMMGAAGYRWMFGGTAAPAWMRGARLPESMMGTSGNPGQVMGRLWADAPGLRVSPAQAARDGNQTPAGARIDRTARTITFTATSVHLTVLASHANGPDKTFRIAGMVNPAVTVPDGAKVSIQVINADADTAHGLVIASAAAGSEWMPMMTAAPAFPGSALWFLADTTSAGMHAATLTFTAGSPGSYRYLCPVPGHASDGMAGLFTVTTTK